MDGEDRSCTGSNVYDVAPHLTAAFRFLIPQERREVQARLKAKGLYSGSVDGLWGKNTFVAVLSFAILELNTGYFRNRLQADKILNAILDGTNEGNNPSSGYVSCNLDTTRCPPDQLCAFATQHNGSGRIWRNEKTSKYVAAAKQRGLTCGVQQAVAKPAEPVVPPAAPDVDQTYKVASGTGFFVSEEGHLITNNHVIDGCKEIKIHSKGEIFDTVTLANDPQNDLALLKSGATPDAYFSLSTELPYALQDVIVAGFPFGDRVSSSLKFTQGIVSSVTGLGNNYSEIQIDAALQPGNSGGPILDEYGNVIAVAVAKLDMKKILDDYGVIPENTNFGVKASAVRNLMEGNLVKPSKPRIRTMSKRDLSALATDATLFLSCWMTTAQIEQLKTRKVLFDQFDN